MPSYMHNENIIEARDMVEGVFLDPVLPDDFDGTANEDRPASHDKWWNLPYICTTSVDELDAFSASRADEYAEAGRKKWIEEGRPGWMKAWPTGIRYDVRCLDGGAWDRPTGWGMFGDLASAIECAKRGPRWMKSQV